MKAWYKTHYAKNKKTILKINQKNYQKTKNILAITRKRYYQQHKDEYLKRHQSYMADPIKRQRKNIHACNRDRTRRISDINYKLKRNLRTRIWSALKGLYKTARSEKLVGCSIENLKCHLEKQFQSGMTWDNYGKWHVDHIKPCSSFDLSIPSQQHECFHFTNLQPLWAKDNISKNNKIISVIF